MDRNPRIHILATGGTIASVYQADKNGFAAQLSSREIVAGIGEPSYSVTTEDFLKINSTYMTPQDMLALSLRIRDVLAKGDADGIVVTHGTSTLEETAFFLDVTITDPQPVVLTGSQRVSTDILSDGPANLKAALAVAASRTSRGRGVAVVFADKIHAARSVYKRHTWDLDAFSSGEVGIIGQVYTDSVIYKRDLPPLQKIPVDSIDGNVDLIKFGAGMDSRYIEASVNRGAKGIVVEGVGLGNVNKEFYQGLRDARAAGCKVVMVSRCPEGKVIPCYAYDGGGMSLVKEGVIFGGGLSGPKARLLLMIGLGAGLNDKELADLFSQY